MKWVEVAYECFDKENINPDKLPTRENLLKGFCAIGSCIYENQDWETKNE